MILTEWERKQLELKKQGMGEKEVQNLAADKCHHADLTSLTALGGPFTKADEVDAYMADEHLGQTEKNKHLYLEIRYARDTSLAFAKNSDIFRLKKGIQKLRLVCLCSQSEDILEQACVPCEHGHG